MTENFENKLQTILTKNVPITRVSQGAEAIVFRTKVHPYLNDILRNQPNRLKSGRGGQRSSSYIIKYRPPKSYRHPILDATLTKHRTLAEARLLQKLGSAGINVPSIIHVDFRQGIIWMEDIVGPDNDVSQANKEVDIKEEMRGSLKNWIWDYEKEHGENSVKQDIENEEIDKIDLLKSLIYRVGQEIGKLHMTDTVHGDLTTSNILLRPKKSSTTEDNDDVLRLEPVLIDFGLGSYSTLAEDKAVDLYVLERAVGSTHPVNSKIYNKWLLEGYSQYCSADKKKSGPAKLKDVIKKLQDVRLRGRKRSMVG